ncbi:hypothetical protein Lalb_Chr01g0019711 [Lupinus albus]|uniref:Uncharacterized protein n=1 Tax=Lupinus albus TaxID=3870 RepID=A0A6A4R4W9_LUPAL|nr:hypothetical protein Lalb_Chr01g0019711 [Lupinus albus]
MLDSDAPGCGMLRKSGASVTWPATRSVAQLSKSLVQSPRSGVAGLGSCVSVMMLGLALSFSVTIGDLDLAFSVRVVDRQVNLGIWLGFAWLDVGMMMALSNTKSNYCPRCIFMNLFVCQEF